MLRDRGNFRDIILAIIKRLAEQISDANHDSVFFSIDPDIESPPPSSGQFFYIIAPLSGTFDQGLLTGGGQSQATVQTGITVTAYSHAQLDQGQHDTLFLTDLSLSIVERWRHVLAALTDWTPTLNENEMTRDPLMPMGFEIVRPTRTLGGIRQSFSLDFDWYLEMPGVLNPELPDELDA